MVGRFLPLLPRLGDGERRVFMLVLAMNIVGGLGDGMMAQNELVFLKSLHGTKELLAFITQLATMSCMLVMVYNEILKRIRDKRLFLVLVTVLSRLPLLLFALYPGAATGVWAFHTHLFVCIFIFVGFTGTMVGPATNAMLKQNYAHENFGTLVSISTSVRTGAMLLTTFLSGILLDADPFAFRYVYPVVGLAGILASLLLLRIPYQAATVEVREGGWHPLRLLRESVATTKRVFKESQAFRDFEFGFVLYGFAMLGTTAIISNMLANELKITYTENSVYRLLAGLVTMVFYPIAGIWISRMDPRRFLASTCWVFIVHLSLLGLACFFPLRAMMHGTSLSWSLVMAFVASGVFSAMIMIVWGIGSAYFCRPHQVTDYQSIHVYMTSIRGLLAPPVGIGLMWLTGRSWVVLAFGVVALLSAIVWLNCSIRRCPFNPVLGGGEEATFDDTATRETG